MKHVKCLVWDLDDTLWDGILLEDPSVRVKPEAVAVIQELDRRGILHSISSRNDEGAALERLREAGLDGYFLYPQINWSTKAVGVKNIAERLNIGADTIAFLDDQPFDRDEVRDSLPDVRCYDSRDLSSLPSLPEFSPVVTSEAAARREMYKAGEQRDLEEEAFQGPREEFLAGLGMVMRISPATQPDLARAEELTVRTNQLNTTGRTYSREELESLMDSLDHLLLVASLTDRYGTYGTIGLALVQTSDHAWRLKLLLMSCRVMSRGVGGVLLQHVMRLARDAGSHLEAEYVPNDRNRMMLVTLRFAGFKEVASEGDVMTLGATREPAAPPDYVRLLLD
ncbi:MAG TPA: HAD-IIIC family phosphatase [Actinomycetota bacterium]|nr:HAD-IIIC family phosphatase [Actinomycetota bacterium]